MKQKYTIFAIFLILCVLGSAFAVSAADNNTAHDTMLPPDYAHNEANMTNNTDDFDAEAVHNSMVLPPDYAHNEANMTNATGHAAGENVTQNATHANATQVHNLHPTGNPVLVLLIVGAVLGAAGALRRR